MNQRIDQRFKNASLTVFRHFDPGIGGLPPHGFHVTLHKAHAFIEQDNQTAGVFRTVERIHHAAAFVQSVPAGAEQP